MLAGSAVAKDAQCGFALCGAASDFLARSRRLFIGGQWIDAISGATFTTLDPATEQRIADVASGGGEDIDRAVAAARIALEEGAWPRLKPADRQNLLLKLADLILDSRQPLAELETLDNGKPLHESYGSVDDTIAYVRYMAGWATKIDGRVTTASAGGQPFTFTTKEPVGVVGAIIPWNFPISMAAWKIVPALVTGCTIVLKPAEQTPLTALLLAELIESAGYPAGVVNVVTGLGSEAGAALANHKGINKLAFTGSTRVGQSIAEAAARNLVRVTLELGGKSPVIVLGDCPSRKAATGAAAAIFYNQGQICCAGSRIYIQRSIYDNVVAEIAELANAITLAPGFDKHCDMGPLISRRQQHAVLSHIESGLAEGATLAAGGDARPSTGYFVRPTVLADTTNEMRVVREEIFGPVLVAAPFDQPEDAVRLANDTVYGLGASIWSNDLGKVMEMVPQIQAGNIWVNTHNLVDPSLPFGGVKASGHGRELGPEQLDSYLNTKSIWIAQ
jgi:phenylacetaldehyde dehydrogenase